MKFLLQSCFAATLAIAAHGHCQEHAPAQPALRMLVEVADLSGVVMSPDGGSVAFREEKASIERNTYDSTWYVADVEGKNPLLAIADGGVPPKVGGMPVNEMPQWSRDSAWLYFRARFEGEVQVWRASRDGAQTERVTSDPADVEAFSIDTDGQGLIYRVGPTRSEIQRAEEDEYDHGIFIGSSIRNLQGLFRSTWVNGRLVSPRARSDWSLTSPLGDSVRQYRSVDLHTRETRPATKAEIAQFRQGNDMPPESGRPVKARLRSPSGNRIAIWSGTGDAEKIEVIGVAGPHRTVVCEPCHELMVDGVAWRGEDELILTARNSSRGYAQSLHAWRVSEGSLRQIVATGGLLNGHRFTASNASCAIGTVFGVCISASANVPPRLERVQLDSGERTVLYDPNEALAQVSSRVDSEHLTWKDPQGREFTGYLFTPSFWRAGERLPLFVTYYACPGYLRGGYGDEWPLLALAGSGIATLCVNAYRPNRVNRDAVVDYNIGLFSVEAAIDMLSARGLVDRNAVGMGGLSYGSEIAIWTAAHSDILAAVSVTSPSVTPTWYWSLALLDGWADTAMRSWRLGSPMESPERWAQISPAYFPERIRAPVLMQMAEEEYRAALDYYVPMVRAGAAVEMYAFPHAEHWKSLPRQKLAAYQRDLDWFRFWLQGFEDSDARKAEQYASWRAMRSRQCEREGASRPVARYCRSR